MVSRLLCVPAGVNFTRKGLLVSDGRRGGVVSYERFCLPLRLRCDEVKLLPVGDPTDPSGGEGGYGQLLTAVPSASADNSKLMAVQHSFGLLALFVFLNPQN